MQPGHGSHVHGQEGTNPDLGYPGIPGNEYNMNYMRQSLHWVNPRHPMERGDRMSDEKYDRININNINFSKY